MFILGGGQSPPLPPYVASPAFNPLDSDIAGKVLLDYGKFKLISHVTQRIKPSIVDAGGFQPISNLGDSHKIL